MAKDSFSDHNWGRVALISSNLRPEMLPNIL